MTPIRAPLERASIGHEMPSEMNEHVHDKPVFGEHERACLRENPRGIRAVRATAARPDWVCCWVCWRVCCAR